MVRLGFGVAAAMLVAAPALAADLPASYPAAPPPSGSPVYSGQSMMTADVSLALGWAGQDWTVNSDSFSGFVGGRVNIPFGGGWNEELEANGGFMFNGNGSAAGVFSHTYYKTQGWAGGLLLGYSWLNPGGSGASVGTVGVEGVVFLPSASVLGKVAWSGGGSGAIDDFWNVGVEGRYYFEPNTKLTGAIDYYSTDPDAWQFTAALEHRWSGSPFSAFVSGTYVTADNNNMWGILVGARWAFDQPGSTLQSHDYEIPFAASPAFHL
ncbi:MAG: hypothetical protein J0H94_16930 [Rhizobiales bacterium]|nr:hypothetical protein [Hyphomicrobiales bacterium]